MGDCFVVCSVHKRVFGWSEGANFIKICICAAQYYTNLKLYSSDSYSKVISDVCSKYSGFNQNIGWSTTGTSTNSPGVRTLPEHLPSRWCDTPTTMAAAKIKKLLLLCYLIKPIIAYCKLPEWSVVCNSAHRIYGKKTPIIIINFCCCCLNATFLPLSLKIHIFTLKRFFY